MSATAGADTWEYFTYVPAGSRCASCLREIKSLELARRGSMERVSGAPVVIYRHADTCPK